MFVPAHDLNQSALIALPTVSLLEMQAL